VKDGRRAQGVTIDTSITICFYGIELFVLQWIKRDEVVDRLPNGLARPQEYEHPSQTGEL
jgi:hypothetical protein